jgi:hypothetical protein
VQMNIHSIHKTKVKYLWWDNDPAHWHQGRNSHDSRCAKSGGRPTNEEPAAINHGNPFSCQTAASSFRRATLPGSAGWRGRQPKLLMRVTYVIAATSSSSIEPI